MTNRKAYVLVSFAVIALLASLYLNPGVQKATINASATESTTSTFVNPQTVETITSTTQSKEDALESTYVSTTVAPTQTIETANYSLYLPKGMNYNINHPLVVALSPSADAASMISAWKNVADRHQWIVYASKTFKNGVCIGNPMQDILSDLSVLENEYPVNRTRIIVTGFSGGAMFSHAFTFYHPKNVSAIVLNTGMIDQLYYQNETYLQFFPRNKTAVFLASPTDFRYEQMKKDKDLLDSLGWRTKWIEFTGGHTIAPEAAYEEAAEWLESG